MNYFDLLGLPQKYDLDLKLIDQQYFAMQSKYHPDRAVLKAEKDQYMVYSSNINHAYTILKNDIQRAFHLLNLLDIDTSDEGIKNKISNIQLQTIWDCSELIEGTNDLQELKNILASKISDKDMLTMELTSSFNLGKLEDALEITLLLKYLMNLINNIEAKIDRAVY